MTRKVTPKQARGLAALMTQPTLTAAAEAAGVSRKTIYQWLRLDHFRAALNQAQSLEVSQAARRLTGGLQAALDRIGQLMTSARAESVRLRAADLWLSHAEKLTELEQLEARVTSLEARIHDNQRPS